MQATFQLGSAAVKNPPTNTGDTIDVGSIALSGRSPGGGNGNARWYSCLENSIDRGAWQATAHEVKKSKKWLRNEHAYTHTYPPLHTPHFHLGRALGPLFYLPFPRLSRWPESPLHSFLQQVYIEHLLCVMW